MIGTTSQKSLWEELITDQLKAATEQKTVHFVKNVETLD